MNTPSIKREFVGQPTGEPLSIDRSVESNMLLTLSGTGDRDYYFTQIGCFNRLTVKHGKQLFQKFSQVRQDIHEMFNQFPKSVTEVARSNGGNKPGRKRSSRWWWEPMELPTILPKIEQQLDENGIQYILWRKFFRKCKQILSIKEQA